MANQDEKLTGWNKLIGEISKDHRDKIVAVEVTDDQGNVINKYEHHPLDSIGLNIQDASNPIAQFTLRNLANNDVGSHFIQQVKEIKYDTTENGNPKELFIKSELGRSAKIRFLKMDE